MDDLRFVETWWRFRSNQPQGWRQRIGQWLADLAGRIDGRTYLAVEVASRPALSRLEYAQCIRAGLQHASRMVGEAAQSEALAGAMRNLAPQLYDEPTP
ncbi:hypothetical protein [Pseudothauera rhizosphaerae]|uniref:hypothetical protein n=1 Tax=Pseudothauera rhizosphaerae TaxID=2565932 RepID=UPI001454E0C1|nr:hypothetical protein [Pseudothauera rhizosphaerae]